MPPPMNEPRMMAPGQLQRAKGRRKEAVFKLPSGNLQNIQKWRLSSGESGLILPRHGLLACPGTLPIQVLGKQDFIKLPPFAKRQNLGSLPTTHTWKHQPALRLELSEDRIKGTGLCCSSQTSVARLPLPIQTHTELNRNLFIPGLPRTRLAMLWLNPIHAIYFMSKRERHKFTTIPNPSQ